MTMENFEFNERDVVGEDILQTLSNANKFNRWMYETIKPYCKGKILEIGSGIGNISSFFIRDGSPIMLTDLRQRYCAQLEASFTGQAAYLGAMVMNLIDDAFDEKFKAHFNSYDTVFALNVVEHIHDDTSAIRNCYKLLKEGGHLIILVPSYDALYNKFDKELGHYRRYTKAKLSSLISSNNFEVLHQQYFNFMGIFGWYVSGQLLKKDSIAKGQIRLYNALVPCFKLIDKMIFNYLGLSTIVVGRKQAGGRQQMAKVSAYKTHS